MAQNVVVPPFDVAPETVVGSTPQSVFPFGFPFWESADIRVLVNGNALEPAAYTVAGYFIQNGQPVEGGYGSGQVTLNTPVANTTVTIDRFVASSRRSQFSRSAPLGMPPLNADLNKLTARQQDLKRALNQAIEEAGSSIGLIGKADKVSTVDTETTAIPLADRFAPYINTFGRGATGNGSTDDTAACQRAIDRALATGYRWEPEPGAIFRTTAPLVIDRSAVSSSFDRHKTLIQGGVDGSTVFIPDHDGACFDIRGGTGGGAHGPITMSDLRIEGINEPDSVGLLIDNAVYAHFSRLTILGMGYGIDGTDVLSSTFDCLKIRGNKRGFRFRRDGFSYPNANTFKDVIVGVNSEYGGLVEGAASFNWFGGTIEGNGSTETSWGLKMEDGGIEGSGGLTMVGVYAELNMGVADLWLTHPTQASSHTIIGGGFARGLADHYVESNVKFDCASGVPAHLWMGGVGFGKVGTGYEDDPSRPYVDLSGALGGAWEVIDAGNRPEDTSLWHGQDMVTPGGPSVQAFFNPTTGALAAAGNRNIGSVTRHGTGDYTLNFARPLKNGKNFYLASSEDLILPVQVFSQGTTSARVRIFNLAGSAYDPSGTLGIAGFGNRF